MINSAAVNRIGVGASPSQMMPTRNAPTAPMPGHMTYAVPRGMVIMATDNKTPLPIMASAVTMEGMSCVKPLESLIA